MEGTVMVSKNEQFTHRIIEDFCGGKLTREKAAELLGVSQKTVQRKARRVRLEGILGVKHGNYGRDPWNKHGEELKQRMLSLAKDLYYDFNMVHCLEKLWEEHELRVSYSTFRSWCVDANIGKRKRRRPSKKRVYRDRLSNSGLLLQMDGSHHKWNGTDDWVLIAMIDDATSDIPYAEFFHSEDTWNCLTVLRRVIEIRGIPEAIYVDKAGWFGGLKRQFFSQFVRACEELGIRVIYANSPEAKGRIERAWQTFQDRLIPELRHNGIKSMEGANNYLQKSFLPEYWSLRNTVEPKDPISRFRAVEPGLKLDEIFCMKYPRKVRNDQTVYFNNELYRITGPLVGTLRRREITIHVLKGGSFKDFYGPIQLQLEKVVRPGRRWMGSARKRA